MYHTIETRIDEGVCVITMNRPEKLNAWTYEMGAELVTAVDAANADDAVLAIVLTGAGRGFCAGADVEAVFKSQADRGALPDRGGEARETGRWVRLMRESKPVVAAVNGFAFGGGCELAMMCDIMIASDTAKFGQPEINLGVSPGIGGTQRMTRTHLRAFWAPSCPVTASRTNQRRHRKACRCRS